MHHKYSTYIVLIFLWIINVTVFGQTYHTPFRYYFHESIENPSLIAIYKDPVVSYSQKKQWPFIHQGPSTTVINASKRIGDISFYKRNMMLNKSQLRVKNRAGIGTYFVYDKNGPLLTSSFGGSYGYNIHFVPFTLSFGLGFSANFFRLDLTQLNPHDQDDVLLTEDKIKLLYPKANTGIYINGQTVGLGVSLSNLLKNKTLEKQGITNQEPYLAFLTRLYLKIPENFILEPSIYARKQLNYVSPFIFRFGSKVYYKNRFMLSIDYLSTDVIATNFVLKVSEKLAIGYGYETMIAGFKTGTYGAHNLFIGTQLANAISYKNWNR